MARPGTKRGFEVAPISIQNLRELASDLIGDTVGPGSLRHLR